MSNRSFNGICSPDTFPRETVERLSNEECDSIDYLDLYWITCESPRSLPYRDSET